MTNLNSLVTFTDVKLFENIYRICVSNQHILHGIFVIVTLLDVNVWVACGKGKLPPGQPLSSKLKKMYCNQASTSI